jgi:hypothetical protein
MGRAIEDTLVVKVGLLGRSEEEMASEYVRLDIDAVTPDEVGKIVSAAYMRAVKRAAGKFAPILTASWIEKIRATRRNAPDE